MNKTLRAILYGLLILIAVVGYGVTVVEAHYVLADLRFLTPVFMVVSIGLAFWLGPLAGRITGYGRRWLNCGVCAVVVAGILSGIFFLVNDFAAAKAVDRIERVAVGSRYCETHYRTKRVGRRYIRSEPYEVNVVDLKFADGRIKSVNVPAGVFGKIHSGDSVEVSVVRGFFGVPLFRYPETFNLKHK